MSFEKRDEDLRKKLKYIRTLQAISPDAVRNDPGYTVEEIQCAVSMQIVQRLKEIATEVMASS